MESSLTALMLAVQVVGGEGPTPGHHSSYDLSRAKRALGMDPAWSALARDVLYELAILRRDPPAYARHLEALLPRFDGKMLERPGRRDLITEEGDAPVHEAIAALRRTPPLAPLRVSPGLTAGAADHVRHQGPLGGLEHEGRDGSTPASRV
ncbi:MAG TPA: hypothetical protein VHG28_17420, partial [Longimicrobiaceae bacterium]|nr:hypothetical protein [Longimicrobiaceae bacterium]